MNYTVLTYNLYLVISIALTIWAARTLSQNGRVFLVDCFHQNVELADSVNHLLVVGFYLINLGFVARYLKLADPVGAPQEVFEALSAKLGVVLLVLGMMHFFNLFVFAKLRRRTVIRMSEPVPYPGI
jgi:hypothetical protein